jgi:hypothetical protein
MCGKLLYFKGLSVLLWQGSVQGRIAPVAQLDRVPDFESDNGFCKYLCENGLYLSNKDL